MAAVEMGGLAFSTLFTLVLVLVVFSLWMDFFAFCKRQPLSADIPADAMMLLETHEPIGA